MQIPSQSQCLRDDPESLMHMFLVGKYLVLQLLL